MPAAMPPGPWLSSSDSGSEKASPHHPSANAIPLLPLLLMDNSVEQHLLIFPAPLPFCRFPGLNILTSSLSSSPNRRASGIWHLYFLSYLYTTQATTYCSQSIQLAQILLCRLQLVWRSAYLSLALLH
jgi:hypothetical protein